MRVPFLSSLGDEQNEVLQSEVLYQKGVARIRDLIAPSAIKINANSLQAGETLVRTHFVIAYPRYLNTNWFSPVINLDFPMDVTMFIHPIDTRDILRNLLKSATRVESSIQMEAESGKIRSPILETALHDINELRDKLQQGTEKFFRFGIYVALYAPSIEELNRMSRSIEALLEAQLVYIKPAVMRMQQGFTSTRPVAMDELDVANNLNTAPLSTTFPFVSADLSSNDGILYGINPVSYTHLVEKVSGGEITVSEMNYVGWGKTNRRTLSTGSRSIKGYIY